MTDLQLKASLDAFRTCVTLNSFGMFNEQLNTGYVPTYMEPSIRKDFNSLIQGHGLAIRSTNNYLLGPVFNTHNVDIAGLAISFNEEFTPEQFIDVYEATKAGYYIHADALDNKAEPEGRVARYKITTVYANVIPRTLEIPGFKRLENPAIDLCFKNARDAVRNSYGRIFEEEFVLHALYANEEKTEFIRFVNYYNNFQPNRSSDFQAIAGNRFSSPEEHIFLALFPVLCPSFKEMLCAEELELFRILADPYNLNSLAVKNRLKAVYSLPIYAEFLNEHKLNTLKRNFKMRAVEKLDRYINERVREVERMTTQLLNLEDELDTMRKEKFYTENNQGDVDDQLEYVVKHPYVFDVQEDYGALCLSTRTPLSMWDPDYAEVLYKNIDNIFDNNGVGNVYRRYIRFFFETILINQEATYWMQGYFQVEPDSFNWRYRNRDNVRASHFIDLMRDVKAGYNPHIEHYDCQGTHKVEIGKAQRSRDLITMIETLMNPLKNWNLTDGAVMNQCMQYMFPLLIDNNIQCIEYEDNMYSIVELYEKFKAEKVEEPVEVDEEIAEAVEEVEENE